MPKRVKKPAPAKKPDQLSLMEVEARVQIKQVEPQREFVSRKPYNVDELGLNSIWRNFDDYIKNGRPNKILKNEQHKTGDNKSPKSEAGT